MPALILLASTLLPEILKLFAADKTGSVGSKITDIFHTSANTTDPDAAKQAIESNNQVRAQIALQLAQLAAEEAERQREADEDHRKFELEVLQDQLAEAQREREAEFLRYSLDAKDRNDARQRQSVLEERESAFAYVAPLLAIMVTMGLGYFLYLLMTTHNDLQNKDVFNTLLGALVTAFVTIITFYFGSSVGSKEKDQLITSGQLVPGGSNTNSDKSGGSTAGSSTSGSDTPPSSPKPPPAKPLALPAPTGPYGLFRQKSPSVMKDLIKDFSLKDFQAAGILGNIGHECAGFRKLQEMSPLVQGSKGGWGWAQWTGDRRKKFEEWASNMGLNYSSDQANYGFLRQELNGTEGMNVVGPLRQTGDVSDATRLFMDKFERPSKKYEGFASRLNYANIALTEHRRS